jgi:hypothetical protein
LECRGREDRPQFGYSSGAVIGRERAAAWESVGRIFGDGFRPALALVCGSARMAHKNPLPGNRGWISPRPEAWWAPRPWHQKYQTNPRNGVTAISGVRSLYRQASLFSTIIRPEYVERADQSGSPGQNRPAVRFPSDPRVPRKVVRAGSRLVPSNCRRGAGSCSRMFTAPASAGGGPARPSRRTVRPAMNRAPIGPLAGAPAPPRPRGSGRG